MPLPCFYRNIKVIMKSKLKDILKSLPETEVKVRELQDLILTNLVMMSEIPAPTFREDTRMRFFVNRLTQARLINCSTDEAGNGVGILPGKREDRNILVVAHLDSPYDEKVNHTCTVQPDYVAAPGISDNALGAAAVVSLPEIIEALGLEFQSNLILLGSSRSLGRGNLEGIRFFLKNSKVPICAGLCVEGAKLGRLSYFSLGMTRFEISYSVPEEYDWTRFGAVGSIVTINEVINRINAIPIPRSPATSIVFNSLEGGQSSNTVARNAVLRLEIRSESNAMVQSLNQKINDIATEVSSRTGQSVEVDIISQAKPGGIDFSHPLVADAREILNTLDVKPRIRPSTSELSAFIDAKIPALTIGLSRGENLGHKDESIEITPIYKGIAQLLGILQVIDGGLCD